MTAIYSNLKDCMVIIYDESGKELAQTSVSYHDTSESLIEVNIFLPPDTGMLDLLFLTTPVPCSFKGNAKRHGKGTLIALFHGKEKEDRQAVRHKISAMAIIESYVYSERINTSLPQVVKLINISQGGIRFTAKRGTLSRGEKFQLRMKNSAMVNVLVAEVVDFKDIDVQNSDYGCRFVQIQR